MGLEAPTYISDLNAAWPLGSDDKSTSDNHHRIIKAAIQATFPNLNHAYPPSVTANGNVSFPAAASGVPLTIYEVLASINAQKTVATYDSGTFTAILVGCTTSPTAAINWSRSGNLICLTMSASSFFATSNATTMSITGLPAALFPAVTQRLFVRCYDVGNPVECYASIATGGTISFAVFGATGNFTNSGSKGLVAGLSLTYALT